jgi:hypothetical protein
VTLTFWLAVDPAKVTLRETGFGLATRPTEPPLVIVRITWKLNCPPDVLKVTVPVSLVPENNNGFAVTVTIPVLPELNSLSQFWPEFVEIDRRLVDVTSEPLDVMLTFMAELLDPADTLKVTGFGLATRPDELPLTVRVTGKVNDAPVVVVTKTLPE